MGTLLCVVLLSEARRVRVRGPIVPAEPAADQEEQPQQVFYAEQPRGGDAYNGLYGQTVERADERYERPAARTSVAQPNRASRVKETPREPPVETIRNYSDINDDGSFTFGYESADGSFKEETRGTDCVVRGKYGYVDPDGNKREFTYVSGNPCDPNAPKEEEEKEVEDSGEENIPQNIGRPIRPLRPQPQPQRPLAVRPATTVFQNSYNSGAEEEDEEQQVYVQPTPARVRQPARPANVVRVTPRPAIQPTTLPATTYRPQLLVSVTPRPNVVLHRQTTGQPSSTLSGSNFDEELKRFQLNNAVTTPRSFASPSPTTPKTGSPTGQPIYSSELVFDPSSGQYNTVVYQQVPKTSADINLRTRLPQYVPSPTPQYATPSPPPQPQQSSSLLQQQLFQQQKQTLFQQSQDLYNQQRQQQLQSQTQQHRFQPGGLSPAATKPLSTAPQKFGSFEPQRPLSLPQLQAPQPQRPLSLPQYQTPSEPQRPAQQFYYFAPQQDVRGQGYSGGQIDAFLRNHNLQF